MALSNETKVGLLVVVALGALGWLSVKSGSFGLGSFGDSREIQSSFADVDGIKVGSAVKVAGVDVGEVTDVILQPNGTATIKLNVKKGVPLPADVSAQITSSGIVGEKFVSLVPGPEGAQGTAPMLAGDKVAIPSSGNADPSAMGTNFAKVADDLSAMTSTLRQVLGSPENAAKLQQIIDGMAAFSNGDTMGNISRIAANFEKVSTQLAEGKGTLGQLIMGGGEGGGAGGAMGDLADLGAAAKEFREVMEKINKGDGTLGQLVNDPQTAEKLNNALDTFSTVSNRIDQLRTEVSFEGTSLMGEQGIGHGDLNLTLQPRPTRFYTIGVHADGFASEAKSDNGRTGPYARKDFGNKTKYTAQFGQVFQDVAMGQDVAIRVGLKNSTGGVGVDLPSKIPFTDKDIKYSVDAYDFSGNDTPGGNSPHVDVMARADLLGKNLYGVVGYDNALSEEYGSPVVGVGLKFQDDDLKYILGQAL